jgi:hypothetical protein
VQHFIDLLASFIQVANLCSIKYDCGATLIQKLWGIGVHNSISQIKNAFMVQLGDDFLCQIITRNGGAVENKTDLVQLCLHVKQRMV